MKFVVVRQVKVDMSYKTLITYLIVTCIFLALAVCAGFEFSGLPYNGTWGSDAEYYYLAASGRGGEGNNCSAYLGYGYVCTFSAFLAIIDMPIVFYSIIGLLYIYVVFHYYRYRSIEVSSVIWLLLAFNPIVIWTFLKGVKEGFVILLLVVLVKLYGRITQKASGINMFLIATAILGLSTVKFEAVAFFILAALVAEIIMRSKNRIKVTLILMASSIAILFAVDILAIWFPALGFLQKLIAHQSLFFNEEVADPNAHVNYLFAIFRFLVGPGPITPMSALFTETSFYEPTTSGKLLIFWGSIAWLAMLGLTLIGLLRLLLKPHCRAPLSELISKETVFAASMSWIYVLTYAFMYGGMVDTRHRAVVYILFFPLLVPVASFGLNGLLPSENSSTDLFKNS